MPAKDGTQLSERCCHPLVSIPPLRDVMLCAGMTDCEYPDSLDQLTQLQTLDLSQNQLETLPERLGQLAQLRWIRLYRSRLSINPEILGQLTELTCLDLERCGLKTLTLWVDQLKELKGAGPRDNELKSLPVEPGNFLRREDLHINESSIPSELTKLKNSGVDKLLKAFGQLSATVIEQGLGSIDDLTFKLDLMEGVAKTLLSGKLEIGEVRDFDIESGKNFTES